MCLLYTHRGKGLSKNLPAPFKRYNNTVPTILIQFALKLVSSENGPHHVCVCIMTCIHPFYFCTDDRIRQHRSLQKVAIYMIIWDKKFSYIHSFHNNGIEHGRVPSIYMAYILHVIRSRCKTTMVPYIYIKQTS